MAATLICLPVISSCEKDDDENSRVPMLNKNEFVFGQQGGVDTLYTLNKEMFDLLSISLEDVKMSKSVYEASLRRGDVTFVDGDKTSVGTITYKDGILFSMDTEWYGIHIDEEASDRRYIIIAHPCEECPYEMSLAVSVKHGGTTAVVRRN